MAPQAQQKRREQAGAAHCLCCCAGLKRLLPFLPHLPSSPPASLAPVPLHPSCSLPVFVTHRDLRQVLASYRRMSW